MKLANNNSLSAINYLIYNPFLVDDIVNIVLKNGDIHKGKIVRTIYSNYGDKTISIWVVPEDKESRTMGVFSFLYYVETGIKEFFGTGLFEPTDVEDVVVVDSYNPYKIILQNLFECDYICRFRNTEICIDCNNCKQLEDLDSNNIFLLGDIVMIGDEEAIINSIQIQQRDPYIYGYRYSTKKYFSYDNVDELPIIESSYEHLFLEYRVGYIKKSDNNYYCSKCIFQDCNKCLISKL